MKILFIFTGGTIGSTLQNNFISTDFKKPYQLLDEYKKRYGFDFEFDIIQPYTELSENNTGYNLHLLCNCLHTNFKNDYNGIVITHGTDTLQYTAACLAYVTGNDSIPICLVSSNHPIEQFNANGIENLRGAIRFIQQGQGKGVFAVYKNPNDTVKIHRGTRLIASQAYSDCFYSVCDTYYGKFDDSFNFIKNPNYSEKPDEISPLSYTQLNKAAKTILRLEPYVGMTYPELNKDIKHILLGSFHSGTIDTKSALANAFYKNAQEIGIKVYLTGISSGAGYESTRLFKEWGILSLPCSSPIAMYMKLWLCDVNGIDFEDIADKSVGGDIVL